MSPYIILNHQNNIYFLNKLIRAFKFQAYFFLILTLFLLYFFQTISLNGSSYSIKDIENQKNNLKIGIQKLESTLAVLQQLPPSLNLVETKSKIYININESGVAVNNLW